MKKETKYLSRSKKWHKNNTIWLKNKIREGNGVYYTPFLETPEDTKCWTDFYFIKNGITYVVFAQTLAYYIYSEYESKACDDVYAAFEAKYGHKSKFEFVSEPVYDKSGHIIHYATTNTGAQAQKWKELALDLVGEPFEYSSPITEALTKKRLESDWCYREAKLYDVERTEEYHNNIAIHAVLNVPFLSPEVIKNFVNNCIPNPVNSKLMGYYHMNTVKGFDIVIQK